MKQILNQKLPREPNDGSLRLQHHRPHTQQAMPLSGVLLPQCQLTQRQLVLRSALFGNHIQRKQMGIWADRLRLCKSQFPNQSPRNGDRNNLGNLFCFCGMCLS
jgi:hypothetical protein